MLQGPAKKLLGFHAASATHPDCVMGSQLTVGPKGNDTPQSAEELPEMERRVGSGPEYSLGEMET